MDSSTESLLKAVTSSVSTSLTVPSLTRSSITDEEESNDTFFNAGEMDQSSYDIHYSRPATIFAAVCACIFTVVGISGNLLTVVALLRCPKLRSHATTTFVISLAVSDLLFCSINLPLTASRYIHEEWILGDALCRLFPFFFYGNVAASLMNMVAITVNRYVLISCHASYSRIYSRVNIFLMIVFVWAFSFGTLLPPLIGVWGTLGLDPKSFSCTILKKNDTSPKKFLMVFGFLMPCIVIIGCYSAIFLKVRQSRRNVQQHLNGGNTLKKNGNHTAANSNGQSHNSSAQSAQRREDIRLTKMMLTIFLCFLVCFLPLMVVNVADDEQVRLPFLHILASVLAWASAVVNPFIYAFKNRQYQQAFVKQFGFIRKINDLIAKKNSLDKIKSGVGGGGQNAGRKSNQMAGGSNGKQKMNSNLPNSTTQNGANSATALNGMNESQSRNTIEIRENTSNASTNYGLNSHHHQNLRGQDFHLSTVMSSADETTDTSGNTATTTMREHPEPQQTSSMNQSSMAVVEPSTNQTSMVEPSSLQGSTFKAGYNKGYQSNHQPQSLNSSYRHRAADAMVGPNSSLPYNSYRTPENVDSSQQQEIGQFVEIARL